MLWSSRILPEAKRDLEKLDVPVRRRVYEQLLWLANHFDEITPLPLEATLKGFFKLRVGDWRIVYEVNDVDEEIIVHAIDRRDKIYKRTFVHFVKK